MRLNVPFWYHFDIGWRQLYWIEQFLAAKHYHGRNPEIDLENGRLIFYKCGTVRFINKTFES